MNRDSFQGIAVYPAQKATMVGVWLGRRGVSKRQRQEILEFNEQTMGHIGVRQNRSGSTAILYTLALARGRSVKVVRRVTLSLAHAVEKITGARCILRQVANHRQVSRALAT
ncbi:MAG: hypothetical protein AAB507_01860 [Patescibacteria group bacterium]